MAVIQHPEQLDRTPVGMVIRDHGFFAVKNQDGRWLYGDGRARVPELPVTALGVSAIVMRACVTRARTHHARVDA